MKGAQSLFNLKGRVAFVTGAASGIGLSIAEVLAAYGATVAMTDIDERSLLQERQRFASSGFAVESEIVDVADAPALSAAMHRVHERHGALDIVCANAGVSGGPGPRSPGGSLSALDMQKWERLLRVNLTSAMISIQTAAELMIPRRSGRILVTASIAGLSGDLHCGYGYAAAKAGVANLVRQAAIELAQHNVTINAIAPGPFKTNIGGGRLHDDEVAEGFARRTMLGRVGEPDEIKGLALLLCSDASSFMTGTVIPIDGGILSW